MIVTVTLNPAVDHSVFIDGLRPGSVNRVSGELKVAGGKGVNVARLIADLGSAVTATGFLGRANEAVFTDLFRERGIEDAFIRLEGETRTGIKLLDTANGKTTDINFPGLRPDADALGALRERLLQLLRPGCWCVFAGSLPAGMALGQWRTLLQEAAAAGAKIAVDTTGPALQAAVSSGVVSLIKPNEHELADLYTLFEAEAEGGESHAAGVATGSSGSSAGSGVRSGAAEAFVLSPAAAAALPSLGLSVWKQAASLVSGQGRVACALVSMGEHGSLCLWRGVGAFYVSPLKLKVASTVGAGDSLLAGFIAALKAGEKIESADTVETALSLGTACAAWTLTHAGRECPDRLTLAALREQVKVARLL